MPNFFYKATDASGKNIEGEIVATSKGEAMDFLLQKNITPISIELKSEKKAFSLKGSLSINLFSKINTSDKFQFVSRLSALIKAGMGISEALNILIDSSEKPALKKFLFHAKANIEKGQPLHLIFEDYKKDFSPVFIGLIKAGEVSGNLDKTLDQLAVTLKKDHEMMGKIKSASFYPILLLVATVLIVSVLVLFIMPKLFTAFENSNLELPLITKILISVSSFIKNNFLLIVIAIIALIVFIALFKRTERGDLLYTKIVDRLPLVGELSRKISLTKFCNNLSMLLASGMPLVEVLAVTSDAVGNRIYQKEILDVQDVVKKGIPLSDALKAYPKQFPSLLTGTMKAGEQSGKLEEMLKTMSSFFEEEVDNTLNSLATIIEPALLLIMGFAIGSVALAILLPMYKLISSF